MVTKDYDEYIDWTFTTGGYDPSDFENMDDYIDTILDRDEPLNMPNWSDPNSEPELKRQMGVFFKTALAIQNDFVQKRGKTSIRVAKDKANSFIKKQNRKSRNIRAVHERRASKRDKSLSKTTLKDLKSIRTKKASNIKLTKAENKTFLRAVMFRNKELLGLENPLTGIFYTKQEALSRAWKDMRIKD